MSKETAGKEYQINYDTLSKKLSRIISDIFIPPIVTLGTFIYFALKLEETTADKLTVIAIAFIFALMLPIVLFIYMRKKGAIVNNDAVIKEERNVPYLFGVFFMAAGFVAMLFFDIHPLTKSLMFAHIINTLIVYIVNRYWKISAHAMGVAGPAAGTMYAFSWAALPLIILIFVVGWARITLKVHTPAQVAAGALTAFVFAYLQMWLLMEYIYNV